MTLSFDDEGTRAIERVYATPDIVRQRAETLALLAPAAGERILDVGSGPGFLLAQLAEAVGPGGRVQGLDPSAAMNSVASARCLALDTVTITEGGAESLPFPAEAFDAVVSTQVYEYVPDIPGAFAEVFRVLRPGGRVLVLDTDWDSVVWAVADRERHRRVMAAWEAHLVDPHLPVTLGRRLTEAGFTVAAQQAIAILNPAHEPETYSAHTLRTIAGYVRGRADLSAEDVAAWEADVRAGDYFFSVNRYCVLAYKPASASPRS
ncbi:methyltransferase domain-containing protein [Pseudonocardia pini]|uniref:methyltransferase domain-containing protein n=1 Tax=Pseudonocardia pini TaxID=2758030 RepID=UPI0015EFE4C5|nr:methyltransferase domain-containing protein [Pseudonocardia pini]